VINDKWAGTIVSTVDEMDCGYSRLAASVTSLQLTIHNSLSHILPFSKSVLFFYFAAVFSRPLLVSPIVLKKSATLTWLIRAMKVGQQFQSFWVL